MIRQLPALSHRADGTALSHPLVNQLTSAQPNRRWRAKSDCKQTGPRWGAAIELITPAVEPSMRDPLALEAAKH
jgi:hypothetical protein